MRRMGRLNLSGALAADSRQDQRTLRTHPTRRPRGDIFLPKQNALISLTAVFLRSPRRLQATAGTAVLSLLHRNSLPSTHIRWRTTASRLATATIARRIPRRWATRTPHLAVGQPFLGSGGLALWAVPVAARVVRDAQVRAVFAAFDMTAQRRGSAAFDRRHDLELPEAHMAGMGRTPSRPAMADVRHLDRRP